MLALFDDDHQSHDVARAAQEKSLPGASVELLMFWNDAPEATARHFIESLRPAVSSPGLIGRQLFVLPSEVLYRCAV